MTNNFPEFSLQETFQLVNNKPLKVSELHQNSMIVNFNPLPTGECPHLKYDEDGFLLDPRYFNLKYGIFMEFLLRFYNRYPSFYINGITSVWKRFYQSHCQLQILFTAEIGDLIVKKYNELIPSKYVLYPWEPVLL